MPAPTILSATNQIRLRTFKMDAAARAAKERHVAGHAGSSLAAIAAVLAVCLSANLVWRSAQHNLVLARAAPDVLATRLRIYLFEFAVLVMPFLVAITFTQFTALVLVLQLCAVASFELLGPFSPRVRKPLATETKPRPSGRKNNTKNITDTNNGNSINDQAHVPFTVAFRSYLQLVTITSILAVDFHVFPRYFAKTETYGTSLMDLGVGGFIFSSGLVAGHRISSTAQSPLAKISKTLLIILVPMILGFARMVATKSSNYQEHVSEYGVHWNFFFTLSIVGLLVTIQGAFAPQANFALIGISVAAFYQYHLSNGLGDYILDTPRTDMFSMNREGILSLAGYYCIFMVAAELGKRLQLGSKSQDLDHHRLKTLVLALVTSACIYWFTTEFLGIPVSRRMANLPYIFCVMTMCTFFLTGIFITDTIYARRDSSQAIDAPLVFASINRIQLESFLVANVLTGTINLSIDTLGVSDMLAFLIVAGYVFVVGLIAIVKCHFMGRRK